MPLARTLESLQRLSRLTLASLLCALVLTAPKAQSADDPSSLASLKSASILIMDQQGNRLFARDAHIVRPIASITKLMTAMVALDANLPLQETIAITEQDRDLLKNTGSRLVIGEARLSRRQLIEIAVMASENRAASALGRTTFAGGTPAFVTAMNAKARALGMRASHFADATGLSPQNESTAEDLVKLLRAAESYPLIRRATTTREKTVYPYGKGPGLKYKNTNRLLKNPDWTVLLTKTGYIKEAGRCLAMKARIHGRNMYLVFLDSFGKLTPFGDSNRFKKWFEQSRNI